MTYPRALKTRARFLRGEGRSILDIAAKIGLAKSTISLWVRDVPLPPEIRALLKGNAQKGAMEGRRVLAAMREHGRNENDKESRNEFASAIGLDSAHWRLYAALLFWCEGSKKLSSAVFTNSDPALMATFLKALRCGFAIEERKLRALVHLHEYHDVESQIRYWSKVTSIPPSQFNKPYRKPHTGKRKRDGYQGCLSLRYGDAALAQKLSSLYHAFAQL